MALLHDDRLFPADPTTRDIARRLYATVRNLPIISPHGHTNAGWFTSNEAFPDPAKLFIQPDHYVHRMLYSQGVRLEELEIGKPVIENPRAVWHIFAKHYYLFRGTPSRLWLDYAFQEQFGMTERLSEKTADLYFDTISEKLATPEFRPRALFESFKMEVLATTDAATDPLTDIQTLRAGDWKGRIIPTFRPDSVVDPEFAGFLENIDKLGQISNEDTSSWKGYLNALRKQRERFKSLGATATDHGHPTARTADLDDEECEALFATILNGDADEDDAEIFRAQMLTEMAKMSVEDGLVMQIHPGSMRNHNFEIFEKFGRDMGADIPTATDYVHALQPMLDIVGNERDLTIILFTLDETVFSRELAPLAGHYPALRLGPPWWFHDSFEGMMRFPRDSDRNRRLLQHGGLQRRHTRLPVDSGTARCGSPYGLRVPGSAGSGASSG